MRSATHEAALSYAARGWRVIRLAGKVPFAKSHGVNDGTTDVAQIDAWWNERPSANVAICPGNGLVVIDVDGPAGFAQLQEKIRQHGPLPPTRVIRSGRPEGGAHLYFTGTAKSVQIGKVEFKCAKRYVVAPPSRHRSGLRYVVERDLPLAPLPDWMAAWALEKKPNKPAKAPKADLPAHLAGRVMAITPGAVVAAQQLWDLPPIEDVVAALELIPNNPENGEVDRGWDRFNDIGMATWRATGGSEEGKMAWVRFAIKSPRFNMEEVEKCWRRYPTSPPTEIGYGTLKFEARTVSPGWEPPSRQPVAALPPEEVEGEEEPEPAPNGHDLSAAPARSAAPHNGHAPLPPLAAISPEELNQNIKFNPLAQLNEKYAVIGDVGGKCLVLGHVPGKVNPAVKVPSFQSFKSFTERYANQYVKVKRENRDGETIEEIKQLGPYWLKWTGRRSYEGIDLVPGASRELPGNHLNLWTGFGVEPREGNWPLMRQHVAEVLASGDARAAEYIFRFAAWAVQHPGERAEVAMVFRGGKGSGKGAFANALVRIFGQHGLQIYSPKHLTGAFNAHLRSCLLLYADEAFWAGDRQGESTLKGMLTEPALTIEQKGVDVVAWRNRLHVIMAANADWVVPASHDERRFAMFNVSAARRDDRAYFTALHAELDAGGLEAMLHDLLKVQLGDWHPRHVPQTAALAEQKVLSMPALSQWWAQILENGALPNGALRNPDRVQAKVLLCHLHEEYPRAQGTTPDALARFLKQNGCQRVHAREGTMWHFPLLSDARKAWEERFGGWDWENKVSGWWDARHPVTSVSQLST